MTLKEVLLVFGRHVGLLINSLQKDGNPRHMRGGRCGHQGEGSAFGGEGGVGTRGGLSIWGEGGVGTREGSAFWGQGPEGGSFSSKMEQQRAEFMQSGKKTQEFQRLASLCSIHLYPH